MVHQTDPAGDKDPDPVKGMQVPPGIEVRPPLTYME